MEDQLTMSTNNCLGLLQIIKHKNKIYVNYSALINNVTQCDWNQQILFYRQIFYINRLVFNKKP